MRAKQLFAILKNNMRVRSKQAIVVNAFGALGYLFVLISWVILVSVIFLTFATGGLSAPVPASTYAQTTSTGGLSFAATLTTWLLAAVAVVATLGILVVLPYFVGKGGSRLVRRALTACHISHSRLHIWLAKALMNVVPPIAFGFLTYAGIQGDALVPLYLAVFFSSLISIIFFSIQYGVAMWLKVASAKIW